MLSQHVSISFPFTVEEVVRMGAGEMARAKAQPLVDAMLDEIGLNAFRDRELPTLSGGEQQRAHFARVLLQLAVGEAKHGPGVLLLDEPTSSLDLRYQINLVETGRRRAKTGTRGDRHPARSQPRRPLCRPRRRAASRPARRQRHAARDDHQRDAARCVRGGYRMWI